MTRSVFLRVVVLFAIQMLFASCVRQYEYEYISLIDDLTPAAYGRSLLDGVSNRVEMPIKYVLDRQSYRLHVDVDLDSFLPTVVVTAESGEYFGISLVGEHIPCYGTFKPVYPHEAERGLYPQGSIRFTWNPSKVGVCANQDEISHENMVLVISVLNYGNVMHVERIPFRIESNGSYRYLDGP